MYGTPHFESEFKIIKGNDSHVESERIYESESKERLSGSISGRNESNVKDIGNGKGKEG